MKILFVINNYYIPGNGISASARRIVATLKQIGEDVRILAGPNPDPDGPQPDFPLKEYKFPIFQPIIESSGFSYAETDMKVVEEAVRWADVVHLEETFVLQWKAIKVARKLGKPITATFHMFPENLIYSLGIGPLRNWKWINRTLLKAWRKHIYNECSFVQCPTETVLDRLRRYHFKAKLGVISNGIVPDACTRPQTPPDNYLDPERPIDILYIGRLSHEKDQPTLMEAMRYSKYAKRIRLHFAGNGPQGKRYKKKARKMYKEGVFGYEPIFSFNTRDQLRQLAATADLCPHCAPIEVEGLSIMEAMQHHCRKPLQRHFPVCPGPPLQVPGPEPRGPGPAHRLLAGPSAGTLGNGPEARQIHGTVRHYASGHPVPGRPGSYYQVVSTQAAAT